MVFCMQISSFVQPVVYKSLLFRNEEKLAALPVYSSNIRVATNGFRIIPYSLVLLFVFRNENKLVAILAYSSFRQVATSGFLKIQFIGDCDVTRLVGTEPVRNKSSLLESFTLYCTCVLPKIDKIKLIAL